MSRLRLVLFRVWLYRASARATCWSAAKSSSINPVAANPLTLC